MPPFELPNFEERYNSVMRFWLKWAIVTLPVVLCFALWVRSYVVEEALIHEAHHHELLMGISRGSLFASFLRAPDWAKTIGGRWSYHRSDHSVLDDAHVDSNTFLGFGFVSQTGPAGDSATLIELPMWGVTLLWAIPPLWLYRRQRKRRKNGFPVEPVAAESTDTAQMI